MRERRLPSHLPSALAAGSGHDKPSSGAHLPPHHDRCIPCAPAVECSGMGEGEATAAARPLRRHHERAREHATNRVHARPHASSGQGDSGHFLVGLARSVWTLRLSLRTFCVIPNGFDLCIATPEANLPPFSDPGPLMAEPRSHAAPSCPPRWPSVCFDFRFRTGFRGFPDG